MKKKNLKETAKSFKVWNNVLMCKISELVLANESLKAENEKLREQLKKQPMEIMICNDKHAEFIQRLQRKFQNA